MKKIIILFLILGAQQLFSQNLSEFTNISSVDDISCVSEIDERKIFFGSSGGIIDFNPVNEEYSILNASNNILDLNVTCIERISEDIVVIGTYAGKLYLLNSENNNVIKYYTDLENNVLVDLHTQNDTLWVAADDFISVFKIIGNTLQFIDLFTSFPVSVEHFSTLNIFKNELYVGASNVFMKVPADYGMYNLKDKSIWQPISIYGNNSPAVRDLLVNGQELLVGSSQGIYSLTNNNSSVSITLINSGNVNKISVKNEILYWSNSTNIVKKEGDVIETIMTAGSTIYDFVVNDSKVYTVTSHSGIYMQKDSVTQKRFSVFPENVVGEIAINSAGDYYVTNSPLPLNKSNGCFKWNGEKSTQYYWKRLNGSSWGRMNMVRFIKEVIPGQFLMCTWGGGFWIVDENEDKFIVMNNQTGDFELQIKEYDGNEYNITPVPDEKIEFLPNILTNISGQDDYAIANYAVTDNYNNFVWICQFESENDLIALGFPIVNEKVYWADTGSVVKIYKPSGFSHKINTLEVDQWGNLWFGSDNKGCAVISIPNLLTGNMQWSILNEDDYLTSNKVFYIKTDNDGYIWIATASGINVWTGSELYSGRGNSQPIGLSIDYIHVDRAGNRWFATDKGISMLKYFATPWNSDNDWIHYVSEEAYDVTTAERPGVHFINLPNTQFKSVMVDADKNQLVVGSYAGMLVSQKVTALPAYDKKEKVIAFPNPVKFGKKHQMVYFKNVQAGANIKILTITGKLVRELKFTSSSDFEGFWGKWDGKDIAGNQVASGVYVFSAYTEDGKASNGKIFVLNEF